MTLLAALLRLIAASVLPGGGFVLAGWSPATALTLYWIENLVGALVMSGRIALHRRWTHLAGHDRPQLGVTFNMSTGSGRSIEGLRTFFAEFLVTGIVFSLAHGVFLAVVLAKIAERPDPDDFRQGTMVIVFCHALALALDARHLGEWPFARLKHDALQMMSRVVLIHLAILGGMLLLAWRGTPGAFFAVFVWLKLATDAASLLPAWTPRDVPRPLLAVLKRLPRQKGESAEEIWRRARAQEEAQAQQDERASERR